MQLKLLDSDGKTSTHQISDALFAREYNEALVHQIVVAFQANARFGNRAQLTRAEVRHSTKKPHRQKGTGLARAGMVSSPLWRGGGRAFPNKPHENFTQKVNRKMYRAGMATILSQLAREERLVAVNEFSLEAPKTKLLVGKLKNMGIDSALLITCAPQDNLLLASRNLPHILVLEPHQADPLSLLRFPKVLLTSSAITRMEEMLT